MIGLQMFKYEYGQLPDALNMFFVKNRSMDNYDTRNKNKLRPAIAKHVYRDRDFRLVGVHVWNYIYDNIILTHHLLHLKGYKKNYIWKIYVFIWYDIDFYNHLY